jgi:hypothetical protein
MKIGNQRKLLNRLYHEACKFVLPNHMIDTKTPAYKAYEELMNKLLQEE